MLREVAPGVLVHESRFMQSNAVVVQGAAGVLLVDPGVLDDELAGIASDLREQGSTVTAGFSTHPHWDHLLWHAGFGGAPRYGTAGCAAAIQARLADPGWEAFVAGMIPSDLVEQVPLGDLFGRVVGLAPGTDRVPWDGPGVRIVEHRAHAPGHAALLVEERGVLVAGDMLSDVLVPLLNPFATDPIDDYLAALRLLEDAAADADVVVPGHGSVARADEIRARIEQDRAYLDALRDGRDPVDPRLSPSRD
ncbi:MBL fold metallo-hydrolase [Cellulomonas sp. PhB150]|uniref:MBL fold metallo-hydrolase n=1 Tax=Cellulomonas sp. PhB150 TaxID=2485188 RepID=UPI000F4602E8|nr:MBL fold metallo-hydrolase [Cellulomonas sp. PhB150]ROS24011.1 glyoxylase-like metal-dependent hydrolase (beta-lactamase superfamily II) [Cellulomonas sp. PhB150]